MLPSEGERDCTKGFSGLSLGNQQWAHNCCDSSLSVSTPQCWRCLTVAGPDWHVWNIGNVARTLKCTSCSIYVFVYVNLPRTLLFHLKLMHHMWTPGFWSVSKGCCEETGLFVRMLITRGTLRKWGRKKKVMSYAGNTHSVILSHRDLLLSGTGLINASQF